jgi:hypothetical protein
MASHEKQNVAVVRRFIDGAVNGRDPAVIEETWSDDLLWRGGSLGMFDGKAAFKSAFIANATRAWDDMLLEIHEVIANDDKVVLRFTNSGTNVGPFMSNSTCLRFRAGRETWPMASGAPVVPGAGLAQAGDGTQG